MKKPFLTLPCAFLFVLLLSMARRDAAARQTPADDRNVLLSGVHQIAKPGLPGPVAVFGPQAFAVILGESGGRRQALVGAAQYGRGRVVALGKDGYFDAETLSDADTRTLLLNAARWAAQNRTAPKIALYGTSGLVPLLRAAGCAVTELNALNLIAGLKNADALLTNADTFGSEGVAAIQKFVRSGGGLVIGHVAWGWQSLHETLSISEDFQVNQILRPAGLALADGTIDRILPVAEPLDNAALEDCNALTALNRLSEAKTAAALTPNQKRQASAVIEAAAQSLPASDRVFLPRLRAAIATVGRDAIPTPAHPIRADNPLARLAVTLRRAEISRLPAGKITADAGADAFPGAVPKDAPRLSSDIEIDGDTPAWASVGRYAPAGQMVTVTIPQALAGKGIVAQIGSHTDRLWNLDSWQRNPDVITRWPLRAAKTEIASPFGGLIYLVIPERAGLGKFTARIEKAVAAPRFVLGKTSEAEWRESLRNAPAPWAELETGKIILTVPSSTIRRLDDPVALLRLWDEALDFYADLGQRPLPNRPERIVPDVQISLGYMHSGYPIMMFLKSGEHLTDREFLLAGQGDAWGFWHELGHNHQIEDWTFEGTGEVTNNLFSLYLLEKISGQSPSSGQKSASMKRDAAKYFASGPDFERWKAQPFTALEMYAQLQEAFGWGVFRKVFAEYRDSPAALRPKSDAEKRDQWLVHFSRAVGSNLGPFFTAWGVPTSEQARQSVADLKPFAFTLPQ